VGCQHVIYRVAELSTGEALLRGVAEVYANHAVVLIGSAGAPEFSDWGDGPANADGRHLVVRTRGQAGLTRVCIWSQAMPLVGRPVFDGTLDLDDYTIFVGDIERIGRWTHRVDQTGPQWVVVRVDDPGHASRVHVGLALGDHVQSVPTTGPPALFDVLTAEPDELSTVT
jgi:hypothetical protein